MENKLSTWITITTGIVALATSLFTFLIDQKIKRIEAKQQTLSFVKDSANFTRDRDFKFKLYDLVVSAIEKRDDTLKQKAASIIVNEMADDKDAEFKLGLLNVIRSASASQSIRTNAGTAIFTLEEKQKNLAPVGNTWKIDVFYSEEKQSSSEPVATQLASALSASGYHTKVRLLPRKINRSYGYDINENEIRFEKLESSEASKILSLASKAIPKLTFTQRQVSNLTPNYISIFIYQ